MARPNILLFFTDQQRFDTICALGNPVIKTPSLDRLVHSGAAFTSAYTCSPVCISARCSLIHAQYPMRTKNYSNESKLPITDRDTFMAALTSAGYRTHGIGKMHFWPDRDGLYGFESREIQEEFTPSVDRDDYMKFVYEHGFDYVCDPHGVRSDMYYIPQVSPYPAHLHPTQWVGDRSVAFIESQARSDQPWFLWSSFIHPHPPFCPPNPWHKLYRSAEMPLPNVPPDSDSLHIYINRVQNRRKYTEHMGLNLLRSLRAYYYACISFIDFQVGRVLDALEAAGQADNTLILFTSDHGEHLGDYNCFGKRSMHDSCARIPLLACWPRRFTPAQRCDAPAGLLDVAATILEAAGAELTTHQPDGVSLLARAGGADQPVFAQYERGDEAVYMAVTDRWKYAYSAPDNREFLFDRIGDPHETRNRAEVQFLAQEQADMRSLLIGHLAQGGETENIENGSWRKTPILKIDANPDALLRTVEHGLVDMTIPGCRD